MESGNKVFDRVFIITSRPDRSARSLDLGTRNYAVPAGTVLATESVIDASASIAIAPPYTTPNAFASQTAPARRAA